MYFIIYEFFQFILWWLKHSILFRFVSLKKIIKVLFQMDNIETV